MQRTQRISTLGGDPACAESQGVPVDRIKTLAFCLCSLFAGLSAIVTLANRSSSGRDYQYPFSKEAEICLRIFSARTDNLRTELRQV